MSPIVKWLLAILAASCLLSLFLFSGNSPSELWRQILSGVGALLIATWTLFNQHHFKEKRGRYVASSILLCLMALAVTITTNLVAHKYDARIDFTEDSRHSLSAQSTAILKELDSPIEIITFFEAGTPEESAFKMLLEAFQEQSMLLHVEHHDPNKEPMLAKQYGVRHLSEVVLKAGEKTQRIDTYFNEENLLQRIMSLSTGSVHEICFTSGHRELQIDSYVEQGSMRIVRDKLETQNYVAKSVNLLQLGEVPASCDVLVIAGPELDFSTFEQELITRHIVQGRDVYALFNIGQANQLASFFKQYGLIIRDNLALEFNARNSISGGDASYAVLNTSDFAPHPTAKTLSTNIIMQGIRSVSSDPNNTELSSVELASTSEQSYAEVHYQSNTIEYTPNEDIAGPIPAIAIVEILDPKSITLGELKRDHPQSSSIQHSPLSLKAGAKIIVVGSSSLVLDEFAGRSDLGNLDLFLNGISWQVDEQAQLNTRIKNQAATPLLLSPAQLRIIILVSLILTPGFLLLGAISAWYWKK